MCDDEYELFDGISEATRIVDEGDEVFSHFWDSGGPGGGAGCESVYRFKGRFAIGSADFGHSGPYDTLDDALFAQDLLTVTSATVYIDCAMMSATALAKQLSCDEDGEAIQINGQTWVYRADAGEFKRKRGGKKS